ITQLAQICARVDYVNSLQEGALRRPPTLREASDGLALPIEPQVRTPWRDLFKRIARTCDAKCKGASTRKGTFMGILFAFLRDDDGATAIEYGLIAAGISIAIIAVLGALGTSLNTTFTSVQTALK